MDNLTYPSSWAGHTSAGISYGIGAVGDMFGVIDHNSVTGTATNGLDFIENSNASFPCAPATCPSGNGLYGDSSWAQPEYYGSAKFLFFENNSFEHSGCCENEGDAGGGLQTRGGARVVYRYNSCGIDNTVTCMGWHGTESGGRPRGGREWEFYGNTITCLSGSFCQQMAGMRSGTGLIWGNTTNVVGSGINSLWNFSTYRAQGKTGGWTACDGSGPYDTDDGTVYWTGTIASYTGGIITVSGSPGWTTNQLSQSGAPYSMHDVTQSNGWEITSNGSNTFTLTGGGGPGNWTPAAGDSIEIRRAKVCLDQAGGRGAGVLFNSSINAPSGMTVAANEAPSPTYMWMNSINHGISFCSSTGGICSNTLRVIYDRDYYAENLNQGAQTSSTLPFDGTTGTTGIGHGTLALRPTSCTPSSNGGTEGTAYWETDHNQLDFCIAPNTWSTTSTSPASYTPYAYPHPLIGGGGSTGSSVAAPTDVTATVQ